MIQFVLFTLAVLGSTSALAQSQNVFECTSTETGHRLMVEETTVSESTKIYTIGVTNASERPVGVYTAQDRSNETHHVFESLTSGPGRTFKLQFYRRPRFPRRVLEGSFSALLPRGGVLESEVTCRTL